MRKNINSKNLILISELKRLSLECRMHSKGQSAPLALMRVASSLESLTHSLDEQSITDNNPLTPREQEVLFHVAHGFTNREIASALDISEKTIEYHLASIYKKCEASGRVEAVKNAMQRHWIS